MQNWLEFVVLVLACYRLAQLIAIDEGPGVVFLKLRYRLGAYDYGDNGQAKTNIGRGIGCPYCVGVWFALPLAILGYGFTLQAALYFLAIAGGQAVLWSVKNDR